MATFVYTYNILWGGIGNNVFVAISGYFLCDKEQVNRKKIIKLIIEILFYNWIILVAFILFGNKSISGHDIINFLLPVKYGYSWFVWCYIILLISVPYINKLDSSMSQNEFQKMLIVFFMLRYILPLLKFETYMYEGQCLEQFIFMFLIGTYIKKYGVFNNMTLFRTVLILICVIIAYFISVTSLIVIGVLSGKVVFYNNSKYFELFFAVLISTGFLVLFTKIKPFECKIINNIAASCLGIYLIHENFLMRNFLWNEISPNYIFFTCGTYIVHFVIKVFCVFAGCVLIDKIREYLFCKICFVRF